MSTSRPNRPTVIESDRYRRTREALKQDPIVQAMAREMRDAWDASSEEFVDGTGSPRMWLMSSSNREYAERGGTLSGHIGAVAEAVVALLREEA